jgi:hypothetical protein
VLLIEFLPARYRIPKKPQTPTGQRLNCTDVLLSDLILMSLLSSDTALLTANNNVLAELKLEAEKGMEKDWDQ